MRQISSQATASSNAGTGAFREEDIASLSTCAPLAARHMGSSVGTQYVKRLAPSPCCERCELQQVDRVLHCTRHSINPQTPQGPSHTNALV